MTLVGCSPSIAGQATWPGERIAKSLLTADELPKGTQYDRVIADPGRVIVNNQQVVGAMPSNPQGCADGLSPRLANAGQPGPENTARYIARFNGANIIVSLLRDTIDLANVKSVATRCAKYEVFFDKNSPGTSMTTELVQGGPVGALIYKQTMIMPKGTNIRYMAFANVQGVAMVATSFELRDPSVTATATMPKTFLDIVEKQVDKIERT
ncbi:hypothetical protein FZI91_00230 [Mycobacterium sp. CBMA271]|nr:MULTISPECIES: hypothetical protein [unclassified Mycobacteroides]MUM19960.1 hypothetical protein [Mycobacteroides sp. CBMA 326]MUM20134.1 hypothetical protein [Mycobacteroides sp. CBMA 271]